MRAVQLVKRPSMPQHLQARVQKLQKKFASKDDFATKQKKAEANRAAFHNAVAAKAAEENDKVMNAQSRGLCQGRRGPDLQRQCDTRVN